MLALEDMKNLSEAEVKDHIAAEYAGDVSGFSYGTPTEAEEKELAAKLAAYDILVAYESVGSWGCDSSSWFLLRDKEKGTLHTISGSHCWCFGFEGQGQIEDADLIYLKSDRFYVPLGGYDEDSKNNEKAIRDFVASLPQPPSSNGD